MPRREGVDDDEPYIHVSAAPSELIHVARRGSCFSGRTKRGVKSIGSRLHLSAQVALAIFIVLDVAYCPENDALRLTVN